MPIKNLKVKKWSLKNMKLLLVYNETQFSRRTFLDSR